MSRNMKERLVLYDDNLRTALLEKMMGWKNFGEPEPAMVSRLTEPWNEAVGNHVGRTQIFSHLLAVALRSDPAYGHLITDGYIKNIYYASALHDVGKNGIPSHVLFKDGGLEPHESSLLKKHVEIGKQILGIIFSDDSSNEFAKLSIEIAGAHHERWDGSGYPEGRYGLDIPLSARIMALVDAYDALRSERHSEESLPHEECVQIILEGGGIDFDPSVVKAFSNIESKFDTLYKVIK